MPIQSAADKKRKNRKSKPKSPPIEPAAIDPNGQETPELDATPTVTPEVVEIVHPADELLLKEAATLFRFDLENAMVRILSHSAYAPTVKAAADGGYAISGADLIKFLSDKNNPHEVTPAAIERCRAFVPQETPSRPVMAAVDRLAEIEATEREAKELAAAELRVKHLAEYRDLLLEGEVDAVLLREKAAALAFDFEDMRAHITAVDQARWLFEDTAISTTELNEQVNAAIEHRRSEEARAAMIIDVADRRYHQSREAYQTALRSLEDLARLGCRMPWLLQQSAGGEGYEFTS